MADRSIKAARRNLPERLAHLRGDRSQRRFARDIGVFQQNVNRYESGTSLHLDALILIWIKENISLDWLVLGRGKMRPARSRS